MFLLDSADPSAVRTVDQQLDFGVTLFVIASKSGKRIETHALLLYFLNRFESAKNQRAGAMLHCGDRRRFLPFGASEKLRISENLL